MAPLLKQTMRLLWRLTQVIKSFQYRWSRRPTTKTLGRSWLHNLFLNTLTSLFLFFFFFSFGTSEFSTMRKIFDHILRMTEKSVLENQSNGANVLHLFRHLRSSQKLCSNPMGGKMFQALLGLCLSKALSPEMLPQGHIESIFGVRAWLESTGDTGKRALEVTQWKI